MKKAVKKAVVILEAMLILCLFSGCWSYHELETYAIVAGIAIDTGQNGYKYHVTFECVKMSGGGKNVEIKPLMLEDDGNSLFEAVRGMLRESDKKLYFNHCRVVIVSSDIAKQGINSVLDWEKRDAEPRITINVLVSKDEQAGKLLKVMPLSTETLGYQIDKALDEDSAYYGSPIGIQLYEITNILDAEGMSLVLPAIETKEDGDGESVQFSGGAVFRGDKQIGWINTEEEKYYSMIRNKIKGGVILTGPTPGSTQISLEIYKCQTNFKTVVSGQTATVEINVKVKAALAEQDSEKDFLSQVGIDEIQKYAEQSLKFEIKNTVADVQQKFDSDIFGFGNNIYQSNVKEWEQVCPKWNQMFKTTKVNVNATVEIENTGLNAVKTGE